MKFIHNNILKISFTTILTAISIIILPCCFNNGGGGNTGSDKSFSFSIVHTNDLHSSVTGSGFNSYFTAEAGDGDPVTGHYGRLAHLIRSIRTENDSSNRPTILVDAGDFYSGTIFHTLTPSMETYHAPELEFFSYTGYDAVNLGNHEFDTKLDGLLNILQKNSDNGLDVPLVSTNISFPESHESRPAYSELISQVKPYIVREYNQADVNFKIAILGVLGPNAAKVSASSREGITVKGYDDSNSKENMNELVDISQDMIDRVRDEEEADVVVLLLHGGDPEDSDLAKKLDGLDIIIAGHKHDEYHEIKVVNNVHIAQTGCDGKMLGRMDFSYDSGTLTLENRDKVLYAVNDTVPADSGYLVLIDNYISAINDFFAVKGYSYDTPVFTAETELIREPETRNPYGTFVTTKLRNELNRATGADADIYFTSLALIRKDILMVNEAPTNYQFSDVFQILPIGFSDNYEPGSPVVTFYLTRKEVKNMVDLMDVYRTIDPLFTPAYSDSLEFTINKWGIPFVNRVCNLKLNGVPYRDWPELVKIACSEGVSGYFYRIKDLTYGLVEFKPKDESGNYIADPPVVPDVKEYLLFAEAMQDSVVK